MTQFQPGNTKSTKLTNEQVLDIRLKYQDEGWTQAQLARHFGVNVNTVGRIVRGETRQRVPMPTDPHEMARRLMALQEEENRRTQERLTKETQAHYDQHIKPERELDRFVDDSVLSKYGVKE